MTIKQQGGIFGRNPTFNTINAEAESNFSADSASPLTLDRLNSDGDILIFNRDGSRIADVSTTGTATNVQIRTSKNSSQLEFHAKNSSGFAKSIRWDAATSTNGSLRPNADAEANLGLSNRQWNNLYLAGNVIVASGSGIDFSATADGSGTTGSELFSEYEEGTFENTIEGGTSAGTCNYVLRLGRYTRVGDQVHFNIQTVFNTHTGTGDFVIGGLPFAVSTASGGLIASVAVYGTAMTFSNQLSARLMPGTSTIKLVDFSSGAASFAYLPIKTSGGIFISGTYEVE